jgi:hypothetical protein
MFSYSNKPVSNNHQGVSMQGYAGRQAYKDNKLY